MQVDFSSSSSQSSDPSQSLLKARFGLSHLLLSGTVLGEIPAGSRSGESLVSARYPSQRSCKRCIRRLHAIGGRRALERARRSEMGRRKIFICGGLVEASLGVTQSLQPRGPPRLQNPDFAIQRSCVFRDRGIWKIRRCNRRAVASSRPARKQSGNAREDDDEDEYEQGP